MTTVAVTGCSGYLGRKVCELLERDDSVGRVVGIDVREPNFGTRNLEFYNMDVRSPELATVMEGCEIVVHLAAVNDRDPAETQDVIVGGMRSVTRAAGDAGVRKLIFTSAAEVYGSHPDSASPLTEEAAVRPAPRSYGAANADAEEVARAFAFGHRDAVVSILRLAAVCGPAMPFTTIVPGPPRGSDQPFQALHEDDAAGAIAHFLVADLPGTFNVAAADVVQRPSELLGADPARRMRDAAARVGVAAGAAPRTYAIVMSSERLRASGFEPEHSSADAVLAGAEAQRGWVSVRGVRFKPSWLAAAVGSVAALALSSAARAARARRAKG
jgi:UDP-glucose 4-epimerase